MKLTLVSKSQVLLVLLVAWQVSAQAQNLLDMTGWKTGTGSAGVFTFTGSASENSREWSVGPNDKSVVVWKSSPLGDGNNDGGWISQNFPIVHTYKYRYTVWVKKSNSFTGASYLGCGSVLNLDGTSNVNAYFWNGDVPVLDRWYLIVGYIHASDDNSMVSEGGVYDGVTGQKVYNGIDYKFSSAMTVNLHRSFLFYDTDPSDRQYLYGPRVEVVNGNEPTIGALLGLQSGLDNQVYFSGKVGIKTTSPGDYALAVNGKVRAQEIKVEMANWPDFVFAKDYVLPTLQETKKHIKEKGHLPGIPSAAEVEKNGVELGDMNKKLLQKIEELTLYLIEMKKDAGKQAEQIRLLSDSNKKLLVEIEKIKTKP